MYAKFCFRGKESKNIKMFVFTLPFHKKKNVIIEFMASVADVSPNGSSET